MPVAGVKHHASRTYERACLYPSRVTLRLGVLSEAAAELHLPFPPPSTFAPWSQRRRHAEGRPDSMPLSSLLVANGEGRMKKAIEPPVLELALIRVENMAPFASCSS
jgi:hypothetical protein